VPSEPARSVVTHAPQRSGRFGLGIWQNLINYGLVMLILAVIVVGRLIVWGVFHY
jgi:hypothetical protein